MALLVASSLVSFYVVEGEVYKLEGLKLADNAVCNPQIFFSQLFYYAQVTKFLADGRRLDCPEKCPPKIFEVMKSCWLEDTKKRPSFYLLEIRYLPSCLSDQSENG